MKRLASILAALLVPGALALLAAIFIVRRVALAVRWLFTPDERLAQATVDRIFREARQDRFARDMDESRVFRRPRLVDGPPSTAFWKVRR